MAEIDIQKKEGTPAWAWIVGLLALLAVVGVIWAVMGNDDDRTDTRVGQDTVSAVGDTAARVDRTAQASGAVASYLEFSRRPAQVDAEVGREHEYSETGLERLVAALDQVVRDETMGQQALEQRLDRIRERADRITRDPESLEHANWMREAFTEAASIIEEVRDQRATGDAALDGHVQGTRAAAESINPGTPLLEQRDAVQRFFSESAEALDRLRGTRR
jgi:hypothetical protein